MELVLHKLTLTLQMSRPALPRNGTTNAQNFGQIASVSRSSGLERDGDS